ncbi:MAG: hypothetical protein ACRDQU_15720 [Pseudonocardiaceae bacterium]
MARAYVSLIQSDCGTGLHKNFEVIVPLQQPTGTTELWHLYRNNSDPNQPWNRDNLEPHPQLADRAQKIVQLTGEFDREGWDGTGTPKFAFNRTESRFGIIDTDLGASFAHQDRLYFLFGDTWRVGHGTPNDDPLLGAWTCLYNADRPADRASVGGIVMRWSKRPYGPWSKGDIAFSVDDGLGKFMHSPNADHTQEGFGADRSADLAGMYGPYQIQHYARATDHGFRSISQCPPGTHIR